MVPAGVIGETVERLASRMQAGDIIIDGIDIGQVAEGWRRSSVVASWLLDLTAAALVEDSGLTALTGRVSDSGEGRWTALAAIDEGVSSP